MQSPLTLIKSLKHGDPQAVAFTAVAFFFVSVFWFSWTLLFPQTSETLPLGNGRSRTGNQEDIASLHDVLVQQRGFKTPENAPNPFYKKQAQKRPSNPQNTKPTKNSNRNPNPNSNQNQNKEPENPQPDHTPQTRVLTISFKGILTRPDQQTVALLSVAESGSSLFLKQGEEVEGFTLQEITLDKIELQKGQDEAISIPRGTTRRIEVSL